MATTKKQTTSVKAVSSNITQAWWFAPAVFLIGVVVTIILFVTIFKPKKDSDDTQVEQYQLQVLDLLNQLQAKSDSIIQLQEDIIEKNNNTKTTIIREYRNEPARVKNLSKEELRKEVTDAYK